MSFYGIQPSFAGGELSEAMYGRVDMAKYSIGLAQALNSFIHAYGGVSNRSGTEYIAGVKDHSKKVRLVPFQFSTEQAYILEFGHNYIRIYRDGYQVVDEGDPVEVSTSYTEDMLEGLSFVQSADVLFICHSEIQPKMLSRYSHTSWTLTDFNFANGPFMDINTGDNTVTPSAVAGNITLTAANDLFEEGDVGALIKIGANVAGMSSVGVPNPSPWDGTTSYEINHFVTYGGKMWRSLTAKTYGVDPLDPPTEGAEWEVSSKTTTIGLQEKRHYTQLMLWQFKEVQNAVKNIVTVGRQEKQTIALMQNEKLSDIANKIYNAAKGFYGDKVTGEKLLDPEEIKKNIIALAGETLSSIETVEAMCRALDGYVDMGPAQRYIFQPIRAAMTRETLELNRVFALARDIHKEAYGGANINNWSKTFDNIYKYKEVTLPDGKVKYVPTDQKLTLTREMAISAVLNMGNEGNRSRLMTGWGWTSENMAEVLDTLDEQDIKYVQGIWNLVESLWPQVKKVHQLMTGLTLEKVEATPLQTKYGKITGGYYPIVTDLRYSTQAAAQSELETALASASSTLNYAKTYTKSNHRKARAVDVAGRPPLLSLSVLDNHLANVIHDFEVAPALRDARKILKYPLVETTIDEVLGKKRRTHINKWLNDVASNTKNNGIALSDTDRYANKLISGTAMFTLGANMGGALMQPLGYFALAHRIGAVRTARAIINGLKDNRALYEFVLEKSDFMREQYRGQNVEVRRLRENWSSQSEGLKWWQDRMLDIYPMLQNLCNVPGWAEAYKMGIEKYGGNDADAIAYADSVIRQTQSASGLADLTTFERSGTWQRWVSMFYSWFRVMYQMQNEALMKTIYGHGLKGRFGDLASYAFYILVAQNVAEALLRGYGPDEDDDDDGEAEKWVRWTAKQAFLSPLSTVPIVRDLARGAEIGRYTFSPAEASIRSLFKLLMDAKRVLGTEPEERDLEPLVWSGAEVVGYGTGLPNRAMLRAAKALWELYDEDEAIPWAYVILGGGFRPKK